ncbi:MAG: hypothetical protein EBX72_10315, partial [Betaproteobacteria bacterium]|nr:hypothetical protein [Betaproteobacteria bacterium]
MFTLFFIASVAAATSAAHANAPMVAETDSQAASLGYKADASKVDKAKYPRFASGQQCANCTLYQGKAEAKSGPCSIFAGKQVAAIGWC